MGPSGVLAGCSEVVLGSQPGWAWKRCIFMWRGLTWAEGREGHSITDQRERERDRQARGWGAGVERPPCGLWASGAEWPQCLEVWGSLPTSHSPSSDLVSPHLDFFIYCFFHCCFHLRVTFFTFVFFKFFIGIYLIDVVLKWIGYTYTRIDSFVDSFPI